jgi:phospholipid/cholesterol/gamma-HCH transport system substrate-binding protein
MEQQGNRELQVGVTVLVAVLILLVGFMWFERVRLSGDVELYLADFPQVSGLQVGDRVQVRGIRMGEVTAFEIIDDFVRVTFELEEDADLREDARVQLGTKGIVGEVLIEIDPGTGRSVEPGYIFAGRPASTIETMTASAADVMKNVDGLTVELRELLAQIREEGRIVETLGETRDVAAGLGAMVAENRADARALFRDAAVAVAALRDVLADSSLTRSVRGTAVALARADTLLGRLNRTAARLDTVLATVETGEGSLGRLVQDESLYLHADSTLISMRRLLDELRRNPKKYFKLSVMDF